jgi:hypothetical protein
MSNLEERGKVWRKYKALKRRNRRALERVWDAIAELEEAERFGDDGWHVQNALELLYDAVHDLEVIEE